MLLDIFIFIFLIFLLGFKAYNKAKDAGRVSRRKDQNNVIYLDKVWGRSCKALHSWTWNLYPGSPYLSHLLKQLHNRWAERAFEIITTICLFYFDLFSMSYIKVSEEIFFILTLFKIHLIVSIKRVKWRPLQFYLLSSLERFLPTLGLIMI